MFSIPDTYLANWYRFGRSFAGAQDDTEVTIWRGERRGDSKTNFVIIFKVLIESPLLSPLSLEKPCHPER